MSIFLQVAQLLDISNAFDYSLSDLLSSLVQQWSMLPLLTFRATVTVVDVLGASSHVPARK